MIVDLDGFKEINDIHGHSAGDELLKRVADQLRRRARRADFLAGIGGDEFAVILPHLGGEEANRVAGTFAEVDAALTQLTPVLAPPAAPD